MSPGRRAGATVVVFAVVLGLSACGGSGPPDVAATVAGRRVPSADVERLTKLWMESQLRQQAERHAADAAQGHSSSAQPAEGQSLKRKQVARLVLGYLIRRSLLEELAADQGVQARDDPLAAAAASGAPEEELAAVGWGRSEIEGSFQAGQLSKALAERVFPDVAVSDAELRQRFEGRPEVFARSWRAQVKAARFDDAAPVAALQEAVRRGEAFEAAASRLGSRETLDLGMVNSVRPLPETIRAALEGLPSGGVSSAVAAAGGFVAFHVERREDLPALSLDQARGELRNLIADEKRQGLFEDWFDKQLRAAPVKVDGHYGNWDRAAVQVQ
jgi:parvulin-like peptidyl-prolyl isomerase